MSEENNDKNRSKLTLKLSDTARSKTLTLNKKTQSSSSIYSKRVSKLPLKEEKRKKPITQI